MENQVYIRVEAADFVRQIYLLGYLLGYPLAGQNPT
jgi:hypothetical protein